jgi:23S rRNA pseudouridine1911/1915/1917 synthase
MRKTAISKQVPEGLAGAPVDAAVRALFELSWGRARDLVRRGKIAVDGKTVTLETTKVKAGASLVMDLAARGPKTERVALPEGTIVHVDAHVVVVEKPSGIATVPYDPEGMGASLSHRARKGAEATLDERVKIALAKREKRGGPPSELGVVHRLDKETSGLVVFTRSWAAKKVLLQAFRFHHVHRRYLAMVHGVPESQTIETHFVPDRGDGLRGSVEHRRGRKHAIGSEKTQRAVTHVEVVERLGEHALVACVLETGRTHQIRIHLSEIGHPLVGERVYIRDYRGSVVPSPRLMLHAAELGFVHPATEREMKWTSELPPDMEEMRGFLSKPR